MTYPIPQSQPNGLPATNMSCRKTVFGTPGQALWDGLGTLMR